MAWPFSAELRRRDGSVGKLLADSALPTTIEGDPAGFVSARSLLDFIGRSAGSLGMPDFGWRCAFGVPVEELGGWGSPVSQSRTLRQAIGAMCLHYSREANFVEFGLTHGADSSWLWRQRLLALKGWNGDSQGEQFTLGAMIRVVQLAAGSAWFPPCIRLESPNPRWTTLHPRLAHTDLRVGSTGLAIAVPNELLDRPVRNPERAAAARTHPEPDASLVGSLRAAIIPMLSDPRFTLEWAASIANTSPRSLRRWLEGEGTSWRRVVDRVRMEESERLIVDPSLSLSQIARRVGYSDPAHFTRSFRRWTGESPSQFRDSALPSFQ